MRGALDGAGRPRLSKKARLKVDPIENKTVLLAPERGMVLNASATAILERCDGERTIDRIASELARETGAPLEEVRGDVSAFLTEMTKRGLIELA